MLVRIDKRLVDVVDKKCKDRECFQLGFDKGVFVQGRGYTGYHKKERPVCMTRHLHGCPHKSICPECRLLHIDGPGYICPRCKVATINRKETS